MSRVPLIVLKFGGSVLLNEDRLRIAVHEICRWRRGGYRVVAVVSALAGTTDALLEKCERLQDRPAAHSEAAVLACGEIESAALLGLHLGRAGVPASVLTPGSVSLRADGPALDASPCSIDRSVVERALERDGVVVFPGFAALDAAGRTVTLGRGGSDLTAIYLADALGADRCLLIKDVDGLYERDPAGCGPRPKRYTSVTFEDALATDGSIIQHKAVRLAQQRDVRFELGRFNGTRPTLVGADRSVLEHDTDAPVCISLALLGLGTVGAGVLNLTAQLPDLFDIRCIAVREPSKPRHGIGEDIALTDNAIGASESGVVCVVEMMGGEMPAARVARHAIVSGASVISANKAMLAAHGVALRALATESGAVLLGSASVGGAVPVLERVTRERHRISRVRGVLNGTSNFVLNRITDGADLHDAVSEAQRIGLAEADPSRDLDGRDSLDKLRVIAQRLGIPTEQVVVSGLMAIDESTLGAMTTHADQRVRQIASIDLDGRGEVRLEVCDRGDAFYDLPGEWNCVVLEYHDGSTEVLRGKGAGRWPTAESVMADLLEFSRAASGAICGARQREVVCHARS